MAHFVFGRHRFAGVACIVVLGTISACSSKEPETVSATPAAEQPQEALLLERLRSRANVAPDEFSVISRAPLEIPQSTTELPTPTPGVRSVLIPDPLADARLALQGSTPVPASASETEALSTPSAVEAAVVDALGPVDPGIRDTIASDQAARNDSQPRYALDRVIPALRRLRDLENAEVVDPAVENARIIEQGLLAPPAQVATSSPQPAAQPIQATTPAVAPAIETETLSVRETEGGLIFVE